MLKIHKKSFFGGLHSVSKTLLETLGVVCQCEREQFSPSCYCGRSVAPALLRGCRWSSSVLDSLGSRKLPS